MNNELSTQQITAIMQMKESQFCLLANNDRNQFPKPVRIGGVRGNKRFYDRSEVMDWIEIWKLKKLVKKSTGSLVLAFLSGKFDRDATKKEYQYKAMVSRQTKPITKKIHVEERNDHERQNCWRGLI
jgi:predicted DNA-binding transcriptional regulator AlpA